MATKKFAIPLNSSSLQAGDITFKELFDEGTTVNFQLTNVVAGSGDQLNLKTKKNGDVKDHVFGLSVEYLTAKSSLSAAEVATVYEDADGGDWDYVEAEWTLGTVDSPSASKNYQVVNGSPYNDNGWPPKTYS